MPEFVFADEWLLQSLEGLVTPEQVTALREHADPSRSLWETLVAEKIATDEQILEKLAARTRLKIADVSRIQADIREGVDESLARRYRRGRSSWCRVCLRYPSRSSDSTTRSHGSNTVTVFLPRNCSKKLYSSSM